MQSPEFGGARVADDDPEVNGLLSTQLLVVPLLLNPDGSVGLDGDPGILVPDPKRLPVGLHLQLEYDFPLGFSVGFGKLDSLGGSDGSSHASLVAPMSLTVCQSKTKTNRLKRICHKSGLEPVQSFQCLFSTVLESRGLTFSSYLIVFIVRGHNRRVTASVSYDTHSKRVLFSYLKVAPAWD